MQGLRGTFFQHGSFLELVSLLQKQALVTTGIPSSLPHFNVVALAAILSLRCHHQRGPGSPPELACGLALL